MSGCSCVFSVIVYVAISYVLSTFFNVNVGLGDDANIGILTIVLIVSAIIGIKGGKMIHDRIFD